MNSTILGLVSGVCLGAVWFAPQDPLPGKPAASKLIGVYELRQRVVDGTTDANRPRGYLAITAKHLLFTLAAQGPREARPLVHSSVREWQLDNGTARTSLKLDLWSDGAGNIHIEQPGGEERRRIEAVRGGVRVLTDDRNWLEFVRIE